MILSRRQAYYERNKDAVHARQKVYYLANKAAISAKQAVRRARQKAEAITYLGGKCMKCGGVFHPAVYDFHHRDPSEKDANPAQLMSGSWKKIVAELDKCDLLCANCHRLEHHQQEENDLQVEH